MSTEEKPGSRAALRVPVPPAKGKPTADMAADWLAKYCNAPPESVSIPGFRPAELGRTAGASRVKAVGKDLPMSSRKTLLTTLSSLATILRGKSVAFGVQRLA